MEIYNLRCWRWGNTLEGTRDLGDKILSELKGRTFDEMPYSRERVLIEPTSIRNTGHSYFLRHQLYNLQNVSCNKLCSKSILCQILDSEIGSFNVLFYVHKQQFLLYFVFGFLFIYYKCSDLHLPTWLNPMR